MKKILLLLFSFAFLLTSCSNANPSVLDTSTNADTLDESTVENVDSGTSEPPSDDICTCDVVHSVSTVPGAYRDDVVPLAIGEDGIYTAYLYKYNPLVFEGGTRIREIVINPERETFSCGKPISIIQVGNQKYYNMVHDWKSVTATDSDYPYSWHTSRFYSEDRILFSKFTTCGYTHFRWMADVFLRDDTLCELIGGAVTEQSIIATAKEYIRTNMGGFYFDEYQCQIITYYSVSTPKGLWTEEKEGFYIPPAPTEEHTEKVLRYYVLFTKTVDGVATSDYYLARYLENGSLFEVEVCYHNVDWTQSEVDMGLIEKAVDQKLKDSLLEDCQLTSYTINSIELVDMRNSVVALRVNLTMSYIDQNGVEGESEGIMYLE